MKNWKHAKTILDGEQYKIKGINIWDHPWINTGEQMKLKDPIYNQDFSFAIYQIEEGKTIIEFAAGEFSNGVWGIYEKENG
jgi:hypothetical protein